MKRIAVLLENIVQFIYTSEESFGYVTPYVEVDITAYQGDVGEFYVYDSEKGTFTKGEIPTQPPKPAPSESEQIQKQILFNMEYMTMLLEMKG